MKSHTKGALLFAGALLVIGAVAIILGWKGIVGLVAGVPFAWMIFFGTYYLSEASPVFSPPADEDPPEDWYWDDDGNQTRRSNG